METFSSSSITIKARNLFPVNSFKFLTILYQICPYFEFDVSILQPLMLAWFLFYEHQNISIINAFTCQDNLKCLLIKVSHVHVDCLNGINYQQSNSGESRITELDVSKIT